MKVIWYGDVNFHTKKAIFSRIQSGIKKFDYQQWYLRWWLPLRKIKLVRDDLHTVMIEGWV